MSVQDPVTGLQESKSGPARPVRRDAVGVEIPVTVHASRTTQGLGKNLPTVHEDTKTVIVLQQGAVVRLTASLSTGETVVLTNRMTGADVLCRVGNIKSQPSIQHYVDLEFIQRAPGFWGDAVAASAVPKPNQVRVAAPLSPAPVESVAPPLATLPPPPVPAAVPPPVPIVAVAPPPVPVTVVPPPPVSAPLIDLLPAATTAPLQPMARPEPVVASWSAQEASSAPLRGSIDRSSFGSIGAESVGREESSSHKAILAVAAAILLVLGGAAGGYWFYSHQLSGAGSPAPQQAANVPAPQAAPGLPSASAPVPDVAPPAAPSQVTPADETDIFVESRPAVNGAPVVRTQPSPIAVARAPVVRRDVSVQLKAPKAKTAAVRTGSTVAPPTMVGALNLGEAGTISPLLIAESAGPAPPPVSSAPTIGGQLQPPEIINSTSAVYPSAAKMMRVQGIVTLDALVDETGKVVETKVISGPQALALAAQESVRNWKYKPARLNGKPIPIHTKVNVRFSLQ